MAHLLRVIVYGAALHRAAENDDTERCHRLIESGAALDECDDYGMTPLDYATEGHDKDESAATKSCATLIRAALTQKRLLTLAR